MPRTAEELEKAVAELPPEELEKFRAWYALFDQEVWDKRLEKDAAAGRLDALADAAIAAHQAGKTRKL